MVILLVDPDIGVRLDIWKMLKSEGFTVLAVSDGAAALAVSREHPGDIDLLFAEMGSPRLSGLDLYREMAAERPCIRVLMMSGNPLGREKAAMADLPFMEKPFTATALKDRMQDLLGPMPPTE